MRARLAEVGRWLVQRAGWIALGLAAAALLLGSVLLFPRLLYPPIGNRELDRAGVVGKDRIELQGERLKLQNDARTTLLQGLGGAVVLLGAWFTYRQLATGREQLRVAQEGQITERFTRAVDQLGTDQLDVRLGGIYALERITRDSEGDRRPIGEILTAYIRQRSPWPPSKPGQPGENDPLDQQPDLRTRAADVQAALTVLGRGPFPKPAWDFYELARTPEAERLDLRSTDLRKANLAGVNLDGVNLFGAHLAGADLRGAHLQGAVFRGAHPKEANLEGAHLQGAKLSGGHLPGAYLRGARLQGEDLTGAHLEGANLRGAHLQEALLMDAYLERAILSGAHFQGANLYDGHLQGAYLDGAELDDANLTDVHLEGAKASKTTRWPDWFDPKLAGVSMR